MSYLLKILSLTNLVSRLISGFFGFSIVRFQLMFSKKSYLDITFQDLSHGILYFSVAQKFVDFVIFTRLRILGNYLNLKNRRIWNFEWKCETIWKFY